MLGRYTTGPRIDGGIIAALAALVKYISPDLRNRFRRRGADLVQVIFLYETHRAEPLGQRSSRGWHLG